MTELGRSYDFLFPFTQLFLHTQFLILNSEFFSLRIIEMLSCTMYYALAGLEYFLCYFAHRANALRYCISPFQGYQI